MWTIAQYVVNMLESDSIINSYMFVQIQLCLRHSFVKSSWPFCHYVIWCANIDRLSGRHVYIQVSSFSIIHSQYFIDQKFIALGFLSFIVCINAMTFTRLYQYHVSLLHEKKINHFRSYIEMYIIILQCIIMSKMEITVPLDLEINKE